jgi:uncharacterized protein YqhQ
MKWILIYFVIGMVYSAITFKKRMTFIAKSHFSDSEISEIKTTNNLSYGTKTALAAVMIISLVFSFITFIVWPFALTIRFLGFNHKWESR